MITPDRIKAFLDGMALLCLKHGICLVEKDLGQECWFEVADLNGRFGGFQVRYDALDIFEAGEPSNEWVKARSIDVSTITAHQRIALERSLAEVRERVDG